MNLFESQPRKPRNGSSPPQPHNGASPPQPQNDSSLRQPHSSSSQCDPRNHQNASSTLSSMWHNSEAQSNRTSQAQDSTDFHGDESDEEAPTEADIREDRLQQLNALLAVPDRDKYIPTLSPIVKQNTIWFGHDKGALVRKITKVFTNKFDGSYYSWTVVPRERHERYFVEFAFKNILRRVVNAG